MMSGGQGCEVHTRPSGKPNSRHAAKRCETKESGKRAILEHGRGGYHMNAMEMEKAVRELQELRRMREELDAEMEALEGTIKAAMGDREQIMAGGYKITWKLVTSSRLDSSALRKALPEVAERFMKTTSTRRFTVQ